LRKALFGDQAKATCGICGEVYPVELLVAAHIKRRADCSEDERRDYASNVMPMCAMGCDALYEKGYIAVVNGRTAALPSKDGVATPRVADHLNRVKDRACPKWAVGRRYFEWHAREHGSFGQP